MNFQTVKNETDEFLNETFDIAIFGASSYGLFFYKWLKSINRASRVKYFIDNDVTKHNTRFLGFPVYAPNKLQNDNEITIVIASQFYKDILNGLTNNSITNRVLVSDLRFPYFSDISDHAAHQAEEIYPYYNICDAETKKAIDYCLFLRKNYNGGAVHQSDTMKWLETEVGYITGYWKSSDLELDVFERFTFIDAGASNGSTFNDFFSRYPTRMAGYYAFEPDSASFETLQSNVINSGYDLSKTKLYNAGLAGSSKDDIKVLDTHSGTNMFSLTDVGDGVTVQTIAIDDLDLLVNGKLCIKMTIGGFEMNALRGSIETIKKYKPELVIEGFQKNDDILDIPRLIKSIVPEYNIIMRGGTFMLCCASVDRFG